MSLPMMTKDSFADFENEYYLRGETDMYDTVDVGGHTCLLRELKASEFEAITTLWAEAQKQEVNGKPTEQERANKRAKANALSVIYSLVYADTKGNVYTTNDLDKLINQETGMPVRIAEEPLDCVALGTGKSVEDQEIFEKVLMMNTRR